MQVYRRDATEGAILSMWLLFPPHFPDGEMVPAVAVNEETYITVHISTLSPSTALIPRC